MAATSFGHVLTADMDDSPPTIAGYQPITGTLLDLLDKHRVSWIDYFEPGNQLTPPRPYGALFRAPSSPGFKPLAQFYNDARAGRLPAVAFLDLAQHEHPPLDVRAREFEAAKLIGALRHSPSWKDSILFLTYDENGGYYDHVIPRAAPAPDSILPGKCADLSNPPASTLPGNGANCAMSAKAAAQLCAMAKPGQTCAGFDHLGFRTPMVAISPFAKPHYVSHSDTDHTSMLQLIEKRFFGGEHLTARDAAAGSLQDMFDFDGAPSMDAAVSVSLASAPRPSDAGCQKYQSR